MPAAAPSRLPLLRDALAAVLAQPDAGNDLRWSEAAAHALGALLDAQVHVRVGVRPERPVLGADRTHAPRSSEVTLTRYYPPDVGRTAVIVSARVREPTRAARLRVRRLLDALAPAFEAALALRVAAAGRDTPALGGRAVRADASISLPTAVDAPALAPAVLATLDAGLRTHFGLTRRQIEVARLLLAGMRNADVAEILGVSESTARHHTERVLARLGAHSRAEVPRIVGARLASRS